MTGDRNVSKEREKVNVRGRSKSSRREDGDNGEARKYARNHERRPKRNRKESRRSDSRSGIGRCEVGARKRRSTRDCHGEDRRYGGRDNGNQSSSHSTEDKRRNRRTRKGRSHGAVQGRRETNYDSQVTKEHFSNRRHRECDGRRQGKDRHKHRVGHRHRKDHKVSKEKSSPPQYDVCHDSCNDRQEGISASSISLAPRDLLPLGAIASVPPKSPIDTEEDYFTFHQHLRLYLYRRDGTYFEDLTSDQAREEFAAFADDYNAGRLEEGFYSVTGLPSEALEQCKRTRHRWSFNTSTIEEQSLRIVKDGVRKQTEYRAPSAGEGHSAFDASTGKVCSDDS